MRIYIAILVLGYSFLSVINAQSSCLPEGLTVSSSVDIQAFKNEYPDCTHIIGKLFAFVPATSLDGLQQITSIGGDLGLCCSTWQFNDLEGLNNLETVNGYVHFNGMDGLKDLSELSNLKYIGKELKIFNNGTLESLDGLENLEYLGGYLDIQWNPKITDISGLKNLKTIKGSIEIDGNDELEEINEFLELNYIETNLTISDNPKLKNIAAFQQLDSVGRYLNITNNPLLEDLSGFSQLQKVGESFSIDNNDGLKSIEGLQKLKAIGRDLSIKSNDSLINLDLVTGLETVKGDLNITNNNSCLLISGFNSLNELGGNLNISYNDTINTINGFNQLAIIGEDLRLWDNPQLIDLNGLSALTQIQRLSINNSDTLQNVNGLTNLKYILGGISFSGNRNLKNLEGLKNINPAFIGITNSTTFDLYLSKNPKLNDCQIQPICRLISKFGKRIFLKENGENCDEESDFMCTENSIRGVVFYDRNGNGVRDYNDFGVQGQELKLSGTDYELMSDENGRFEFLVDSGQIYNVSIAESDEWSIITDSIYSFTFIPGDSINNQFLFGIQLKDNTEYKGELNISSEPTRCNTEVVFHLRFRNTSSKLYSGMIELEFDPLTNFVSSTSTVNTSLLDENKLVINFPYTDPFEYIDYDIILKMPTELETGSSLLFKGQLLRENSNGFEPLDIVDYHEIVLCSYDPNDKMVNPPGVKDQNYVPKDKQLSYTVRFQNTGNAEAIDVKIRDTISEYLDINTLEVVQSSFPLELTIKDQAVEFYFRDINLPDSTSNEQLSHGFVTYNIFPKADISTMAKVENTAHIIFDFNPAIVTNTTQSTLVDSIGSDVFIFVDTFACVGDTLLGYTTDISAIDTIDNQNLCLTIVNTNIAFIEPNAYELSLIACEGDTLYDDYIVGPLDFVIVDSIYHSLGCLDSIVTYNVQSVPQDTIEEIVTICFDESYGVYTESGIYNYLQISGITGCNQSVLLDLIVLDRDTISIDTSICQGENFASYDTTGYYEYNDIDPETGCSVINQLNLNVIFGVTHEIDTTICEGFDYLGLLESGTYTIESLNEITGCLESFFINLTVLDASDSECINSLEEINKNITLVTPNPTAGLVYCKSKDYIDAYYVFDLSGRSIFQKEGISKKNITIDLSSFIDGVYIIKLVSKNQNETIRVVKF